MVVVAGAVVVVVVATRRQAMSLEKALCVSKTELETTLLLVSAYNSGLSAQLSSEVDKRRLTYVEADVTSGPRTENLEKPTATGWHTGRRQTDSVTQQTVAYLVPRAKDFSQSVMTSTTNSSSNSNINLTSTLS